MSLISEINRIKNAKDNLYNSILNRNIEISLDTKFDSYIEKISNIGNKQLDKDFTIDI